MTERHWRPSLAFVLVGALVSTLAMSFAGLVALRYLGPVIGFRVAAIGLGTAILFATLALGWLLARLLLRPIRALEAYAISVRDGKAAPPRHFGTKELWTTARQVIGMAEELRDREASIRSYSDHVTHELKSPVAAIRAAVEMLQDGKLTPEDRRLIADIDGARYQMETHLDALRAAARARETRHIGLSTLAGIAPTLRTEWPALALTLHGSEVSLPIAAEGLLIVLRQLLRNSAEHGATEVVLTADGRGRSILVRDNGAGISPGNAPHVFEPYYTTRREDGGTGMGLTIVRNLLRAHRASIALVPGETGAVFRIQFGEDGERSL